MDYLVNPGSGKTSLVDVVIPALNEQETIGKVVGAFRNAPGIGQIIVVSDLSTDRTGELARKAGAKVIKGPGEGKGQAMMAGLAKVKTPRVIFADADLNGFASRHARALASMPIFGQIVGFRDKGTLNALVAASGLPPISGERSVPTNLVRQLDLQGYAAETQINAAMVRNNLPSYHFFMRGVTGIRRAGPLRLIDVAPTIPNYPELLGFHKIISWRAPV